MKKILYFLILLLLPISVEAYGIDNYRMDVTVLENGDLHVYEMFELTGKYNGMERIINYKSNYNSGYGNTLSSTGNAAIYNGSNIVLNAIKGVKFSNDADLKTIEGDTFTKVSSAQNGKYGVYTLKSSGYGYTYRMYNPSKEHKAFYLDYMIKDMAITHEDVTEVGWNIFTSMNESIGNLEIYIHIPNNKDLLMVWAHGPLWGDTKIIDNETLYVNIQGLDANEAIDVRFVFDKILTTQKTTDMAVLDKIVNIEAKLAQEADLKRDQAYNRIKNNAQYLVNDAERNVKRDYYEAALDAVNLITREEDQELKKSLEDRLAVVLEQIEKEELRYKIINYSIGTVYLIGLIFLTGRTYIKYDKEYEPEFKNKYYRDFPAEYSPSTVGYLMRRKVNTDDLSAGIMDLIRKKALVYTPLDEKGKDFKFTKGQSVELTKEEEKIMEFLFYNDKIEAISLKELKRKARDEYLVFIERYKSWELISTAHAKKEDFYEEKEDFRVACVFYAIIGIIYGIYGMFRLPIFIALIVISIICMIYFVTYTKRTKKGNEEYVKWKGLKNFMEDFGTMDTKELPEIELWDKYLVYAITLGCADKLSKVMEIKVKEMGDGVTVTTFDLNQIHNLARINQSITSAVATTMSSAYSEKTAREASSSSSSDGFGGGFSGGGGSFGGGGGGGRF